MQKPSTNLGGFGSGSHPPQAAYPTPTSQQQQTQPPLQGPPPPPQQLTHQQQQQFQQQQQQEMEMKKLQDITEAINLITYIREDVKIIMDNVGKANSHNDYAGLLAGKLAQQVAKQMGVAASSAETSSASAAVCDNNKVMAPSGTQQVATPASVHSLQQQQQNQQTSGQATSENAQSNEISDTFFSLDIKEQEFYEKTDNKYLLDRVIDINKCLGYTHNNNQK